MMRIRLRLAALFSAPALLFATAAPAHAQGGALLDAEPTVAAALTDDLIRIDSRFEGARLDVFGVVNGLAATDDVVVVVQGPRQPILLMRKRRIFGIWINGRPTEFEGAPAYYATASTRPLDEIAPIEELSRHDIGIQHAPLRPVGEDVTRILSQLEEYRAAIVRIKGRDFLYRDIPDGVDVFDGGLFRAQVFLPAGSPTGEYRADIFVFREGMMAARRSALLRVEKIGLERFVFETAHAQPMLYGLTAVLFAIFAGWVAAMLYRRR